jgi:hypothetical protein
LVIGPCTDHFFEHLVVSTCNVPSWTCGFDFRRLLSLFKPSASAGFAAFAAFCADCQAEHVVLERLGHRLQVACRWIRR